MTRQVEIQICPFGNILSVAVQPAPCCKEGCSFWHKGYGMCCILALVDAISDLKSILRDK